METEQEVLDTQSNVKPKETHTSTEQVHYPWLMQEKTPVEASSLVGIGAQGDDLAAAAVVKLQHRRPLFNGMSLGGVEFDAAACLDEGLK